MQIYAGATCRGGGDGGREGRREEEDKVVEDEDEVAERGWQAQGIAVAYERIERC